MLIEYKEEDLTPGFPFDVKPARPGVYIVGNLSGFNKSSQVHYSRWDGKIWRGARSTPEAATLAQAKSNGCYDGLYTAWYGLKAKP